MNLLGLPKDVLRMILHKLDRVEDLISFSYLNKDTYEFCRSNRKFLLKKWDKKIYDFEIETRVVTTVVKSKVIKHTQYICPLCLYVSPNPIQIGCNDTCIDCGRRFCRDFYASLGMSNGDGFYRHEPLRINKHGRGYNLQYRCYDCHLFEYVLINHNRTWANRTFTPEEKVIRDTLIAEKKKQDRLLKQRIKEALISP